MVACFYLSKGKKDSNSFWIKEASTDTSNQIFMINEMSGFDNKLIVFI